MKCFTVFDQNTQRFDHYFDLLLYCEDDPSNESNSMITVVLHCFEILRTQSVGKYDREGVKKVRAVAQLPVP